MYKKIIIPITACLLVLTLSGCTWWDDKMKSFKSNTNGLKRTVQVYSYTGELLKTYKGNSVRLDEGKTGTLLQVDGKRITITNATVITEEE